jgi:predicted nuclease with RNAse H fold
MTLSRSAPIVAGIDVGSTRKGFHAVALSGQTLSKFSSTDPKAIANWCGDLDATVVAVDAPIAWSATGRARPAERALMNAGIWSFSTPTEEAARSHVQNYFGWMLNGAALYRALQKRFEPFNGSNDRSRPIVFETFPHAVTCALAGQIVRAADKRRMRREFLNDAGVCCDLLSNIDYVDAALCALTAAKFAQRRFEKHGDPIEGYIVVPLKD